MTKINSAKVLDSLELWNYNDKILDYFLCSYQQIDFKEDLEIINSFQIQLKNKEIDNFS